MAKQDNSRQRLRDTVAAALKEMDPTFDVGSDGYMEATVLAASVILGASEGLIADELEYDREFVDLVGNRLRNAGVWNGDAIDARAKNRWFEEEAGGIAFMCDINVANGTFVIANYDGIEPRYSLSPAGNDRARKLMGGMLS